MAWFLLGVLLLLKVIQRILIIIFSLIKSLTLFRIAVCFAALTPVAAAQHTISFDLHWSPRKSVVPYSGMMGWPRDSRNKVWNKKLTLRTKMAPILSVYFAAHTYTESNIRGLYGKVLKEHLRRYMSQKRLKIKLFSSRSYFWRFFGHTSFNFTPIWLQMTSDPP